MEFCVTDKTVSPKLTQIKEAVSALYLTSTIIFEEENGEERPKAAEVVLWSNMYVLYTTPEGMKGVEPTQADVGNSIRNTKCWHTVHFFFFNNYRSPLL